MADVVGENKNNEMGYRIEMIRKEDKPRVIKFLRRFFFRDEPLNHSIQLIPDEEDGTCLELEEYSLSALDDNLSLMAIATNGSIIGVQLNGKKHKNYIPFLDSDINYPNISFTSRCRNKMFCLW